jgi:hypothetical protein
MNIASLVLIWLSIVTTSISGISVANGCSHRRVRKEVHDLSPQEFQNLVSGFQQMYKDGAIQKYVEMHIRLLHEAHNNPRFLPYHRLMTQCVFIYFV